MSFGFGLYTNLDVRPSVHLNACLGGRQEAIVLGQEDIAERMEGILSPKVRLLPDSDSEVA